MPPKAKSTTTKVRKNTKKTNLTKLYNQMHKMSLDAVDNEIIKRFKILIDASEDDVSKNDVDQLMNDPKNSDASIFPEGLQPYVRHYIFMSKRQKNQK